MKNSNWNKLTGPRFPWFRVYPFHSPALCRRWWWWWWLFRENPREIEKFYILHFPFLNDPESEFNFSSFFNPLPLSFCFHLKLNHDSVPVLNEKLSGKCFASLKNTFSMFQGDEGHALKWWKYFTTAHKFYEERQKCKKLRLFRADDPSTCSWQFYSHQLNDTRILLVSNLWVKSEQ